MQKAGFLMMRLISYMNGWKNDATIVKNMPVLLIRVGKKYRYTGIPRYSFGVVRTAAHLPVTRYSGVSIFSNRNP